MKQILIDYCSLCPYWRDQINGDRCMYPGKMSHRNLKRAEIPDWCPLAEYDDPILDQLDDEDTIKWPEMPHFQLVAMESKGKPWYKRLFVWFFTTRQYIITKNYIMPCGMEIEKGSVVDGASIPKLLRWLVSPTGPLFIPSLKHDKGYKDNPGDKTKLYWDKEFRNDSMLINGIYVLSYGAWLAVAGFAWLVWWKHRRNEVA